MVEIQPVSGRAALRAFIELPYALYRGHPHWVPPLRLAEPCRARPPGRPLCLGRRCVGVETPGPDGCPTPQRDHRLWGFRPLWTTRGSEKEATLPLADGPWYRHAPTALTIACYTTDTLYMRSILQRGTEQLQYEIYTSSGQTPYGLRVTAQDGRLVFDERFPEPYALHERAASVERLLVRQGWRGPLLDR